MEGFLGTGSGLLVADLVTGAKPLVAVALPLVLAFVLAPKLAVKAIKFVRRLI